MAPPQSNSYTVTLAIARALGWITSVATMLVLGFIAHRWPHKEGSVMAGIFGTAIAMLNDSWHMAAATRIPFRLPPMSATRAMFNDMIAMAVCMGGVILVLFTGGTNGSDAEAKAQEAMEIEKYGPAFTMKRLMLAAQWFLVGVVLWRLLFAVWVCFEGVKRAVPEDHWDRQMEETETYDA